MRGSLLKMLKYFEVMLNIFEFFQEKKIEKMRILIDLCK